MPLSKDEFLESLTKLLTVIEDEHNFEQEPLNHRERVLLSAFANTALNLGYNNIRNHIKKALSTNDAASQEIVLFSGIDPGVV